jgi:dipeptidyl aminopeptidase/acylaminoacyl peptidase
VSGSANPSAWQDDVSTWEQRFLAPTLSLPVWARDAPDRLAVSTSESGSWQVYAWDRAAGTRRRVTDNPIGVFAGYDEPAGFPTPDGSRLVWFEDRTGDEVGRWLTASFDSAGDQVSTPRPLVDGVPDAWSEGVAVGTRAIVLCSSGDDGFAIWVSVDGAPGVRIHHHPQAISVGGLSRDERLFAIEHAEHGDTIHPALRILETETGRTVADLWDGEGLGLHVADWSPVEGDQRVAIVHERGDVLRPAIWDPTTGGRTDLDLDLPGDVTVMDWWPDASALLLLHQSNGRSELWRLTVATGELARVEHPTGTIAGAAVRPDGTIWYLHASGHEPPSLRASGGDGDILALDGPPAPGARPYEAWAFRNARGDEIRGFYVTPEGNPPFPTIMDVHGGPTWDYADEYRPSAQAWVDHGFAVAMVNYRGSTGRGRAFRDALIGDPGFPETEDVIAGLDDLIARGITDPERAVVAGNSWGGYITLLCVGLHPDRFVLGLGGVPVADYPVAYEDEAETLRAMDRTLFGGSPAERPDLYRERSPLTYIRDVRAPLLILAGSNDPRCPIRQILNYCDRLRELGKPFELYRYDAGHGALVIAEQVRQMRARLAFTLERVEGVREQPA